MAVCFDAGHLLPLTGTFENECAVWTLVVLCTLARLFQSGWGVGACQLSLTATFPPPALSDPTAKENCMMHLLRSLPDPNLITFLFLLEHLKR